MLLASQIIAPGPDDTAPRRQIAAQTITQHPVQDPPRRQQILQRAQRPRHSRAHRALQISPRRRDQQPAAIRQHQDQLQPPAAAHPPDQLKRAARLRVARPHHPHARRKAIEVGLVSCLLSIGFSTTR
jgi:predicted metal-dependent phosphoesterase TrpH